MDLGITGRIALVGASGRGLGLATAKRLAMEGVHVALCDKDPGVLDQATETITSIGAGGRVFAYPTDLTLVGDIQRLVENVHRDLGPVSILVTNSGGPAPGTFADADDEKWELAYRLTFLSAVRLIRTTLDDMKQQRWGRIINFTSRALKEPIPGLIISNAVRLAVAGMAKTLALEVAQYGITVNNICPGPTSTERALELAANRAAKRGVTIEEELAQTSKDIPMGRLAVPDEPAAAAAFLASDLARYITGISLLVDGGAVRAL